MDILYQLQGITFEWAEQKARSNVEKHGITFEEAAEAFFDPFYQMGDASPEDGVEERDFLLGYSQSSRLLLVVHAQRRERVRLISARLATRAERKIYEDA